MSREVQHEPENGTRNCRQSRIQQHLIRPGILLRGIIHDSHLRRMGQIEGKVSCAQVAPVGIARHRSGNDGFEFHGYLRIHLAHRGRVAHQAGIHDCEWIHSLKRRLPGHHFIKNDAQGINVAARVAAFALYLFGRNVVHRPDRWREFAERQAPRAALPGDAEVHQLDLIFLVDHDILRLQITMHYAVRVNVIEDIADRDRQPHCAIRRDRSIVENLAQQPAFRPLHHHVNPALAALLRQHTDHTGMIQFPPDLSLALKAIEERNVRLGFRMRYFNSHVGASAQIGSAVNRRHASLSRQFTNAVIIQYVTNLKYAHGFKGSRESVRNPLEKRWNSVRVGCLSLIVLLLAGCFRDSHDPLPGFPKLILWAWERPENLSFIVPEATGVAFLAETITVEGDRSSYRPRMRPLRVPPGTHLIAVVRIESRGPHRTLPGRVVDDVLRATLLPRVAALQIDYDAQVSERPFYRDLLAQIRRQMPRAMPLEITALVSWCMHDDWLRGLPVADAVPMFFRMGSDPHQTNERLHEPLCTSSIGISTDEFYAGIPRKRRVFVFRPRPWTETGYRAVLQESAKWQ
jgi:hypothetical protein